MATSNNPSTFNWGWAALAGLIIVVGLGIYWGLTPPPQVGHDEEVIRTLDALFTAVVGRNEEAVVQCQGRLAQSREGGQLPPAAARRLDVMIDRAKAGGWDEAARDLYAFIRAQRGDT